MTTGYSCKGLCELLYTKFTINNTFLVISRERERERERRVFGGLASLAAYGASGSGRRLKHVRVAIRQAVYDRVNADTADATIDLDVRLVLPVLQPLY